MALVHYCAQISVEMQRDKRIWRKSIIVPKLVLKCNVISEYGASP